MLARPPLLEGLFAGVLAGAVLGLRSPRFDRRADGSDGYLANPWIGVLHTALQVGRGLAVPGGDAAAGIGAGRARGAGDR